MKKIKSDSSIPEGIELLCESSWEVCNKVGGIYTVLSTKAVELKKQFGSGLVFIGPDIWDEENPSPVFLERKSLLRRASAAMKLPYGLKCRAGRWDIPGSPQVILVDYRPLKEHLPGFYGEMWEHFGVDSLHGYGDYDDSCAFAIASAMVIRALADHLKVRSTAVAAHFDEWTTGMGLLWLRLNSPGMATLFTTHATTVGRSICSNGKPLYQYFNNYDGTQMSRELNVEAKHSLEAAAAREADCFTTVSEVTARECTRLLGVTPDVITPNGFEPDFVPDSTRRARLREEGRRKILSIARDLTGREYPDSTLIVATSGRNEYRNKGLDLYLDSLFRFGEIENGTPRETVALVLTPAWVSHPSGALLIDEEDHGNIKPGPDFLTHRLCNEDTDSVAVKISQLENMPGGCWVTFIYVPCYLDGHDGIVNISYYDLLPAIDITIFPSYYEPWGYTPLESISFGIPTITTDKSGFGQWILGTKPNVLTETGVRVVPRTDSNYRECSEAIANELASFADLDSRGREKICSCALATARSAEWPCFISKYDEAFAIASKHADERNAESATKA